MNTEVSRPIELRWLVSFPASCLHAAEAIARGQLIVDPVLAEAVTESAQELRRVVQSAQFPRTVFWRHLIGLSTLADGASELAIRAATKTVGASRAELVKGQIAGAIGAVESAVRRAIPHLVDEVTVQAESLREAWDRTGRHLLPAIGRWSDARLIVESAEVIAVHPAMGGGGAAHLPYNNVHIEVLPGSTELPRLPEVLRLAWMLSQLNLDLPEFSESIHAQRLPRIAELAMLAPTLRAGIDTGIIADDDQLLATALAEWNISMPADVDPLDLLTRWWETYLDTRPRWGVAMTALDRMIG